MSNRPVLKVVRLVCKVRIRVAHLDGCHHEPEKSSKLFLAAVIIFAFYAVYSIT